MNRGQNIHMLTQDHVKKSPIYSWKFT